jgi:5-enolpyruvylshikimate-3-phosphate synthase
MIIQNPEVTAKSFPEFWETLQQLGLQVEFCEV